jgi:hypothetical protein
MIHPDLIPPPIVRPAVRLAIALVQKINDREKKVVKATLDHAKQQGEDLLRAKKLLGSRKLAPWLACVLS